MIVIATKAYTGRGTPSARRLPVGPRGARVRRLDGRRPTSSGRPSTGSSISSIALLSWRCLVAQTSDRGWRSLAGRGRSWRGRSARRRRSPCFQSSSRERPTSSPARAEAVAARAYAPYSNYPSAAAVRRARRDAIYEGVNVENAAYPLGSLRGADGDRVRGRRRLPPRRPGRRSRSRRRLAAAAASGCTSFASSGRRSQRPTAKSSRMRPTSFVAGVGTCRQLTNRRGPVTSRHAPAAHPCAVDFYSFAPGRKAGLPTPGWAPETLRPDPYRDRARGWRASSPSPDARMSASRRSSTRSAAGRLAIVPDRPRRRGRAADPRGIANGTNYQLAADLLGVPQRPRGPPDRTPDAADGRPVLRRGRRCPSSVSLGPRADRRRRPASRSPSASSRCSACRS